MFFGGDGGGGSVGVLCGDVMKWWSCVGCWSWLLGAGGEGGGFLRHRPLWVPQVFVVFCSFVCVGFDDLFSVVVVVFGFLVVFYSVMLFSLGGSCLTMIL